MGNSSVVNSLKEMVNDIIDSNGKFRVTPIGLVGNRGITPERLGILEDLVTFIKATGVACEETRIYIFDRYITLVGVTETMNLERGDTDRVNANTTKAKIWYDKTKLDRLLGGTFIADLVFSSAVSADELRAKLASAYSRYSGDTTKLRSGLRLEISKDVSVSDISDDEFDEFVSIISPYTKTQMAYIEANIPKEQAGYFNYIITGMGLTDVDRERLARLRDILD